MPRPKGFVPSEETRKKISIALKIKGIKPPINIGKDNYFWKGGITNINESARKSTEYKNWRKSVFERDDWKCVECNSKENLQADHIKRFSDYPELRFTIENGRTLCYNCHRKTETWGNHSKK